MLRAKIKRQGDEGKEDGRRGSLPNLLSQSDGVADGIISQI